MYYYGNVGGGYAQPAFQPYGGGFRGGCGCGIGYIASFILVLFILLVIIGCFCGCGFR